MDETLLCYCTCPSDEVAQALARGLVEQKLAACVNILPGVTSIYRWQGEILSDSEVLLLVKTVRRQYPAVEAFICAEHPYELPEIIGVSIAAGSPPYLQWLKTALE